MANQYWWVNQGKTYVEERDQGVIWAPLRRSDGHRVSHWESMTRVAPGDVILHYGNTHLRGVSRARTAAVDSPRPFADTSWGEEGRSVEVSFEELEEPVHRDEIPIALRTGHSYKNSPFDPAGNVNQGYLFDLAPTVGAAILDVIEGTVARQPVSQQSGQGEPSDGNLPSNSTRVYPWTPPAYDPSVVHPRDSTDDLASDNDRVVTFEEFRLQSDFGLWLSDQGNPPSQIKIPVVGSTIQPDLFVPERGWIIEAKKSPARPYVRLAIGQVLDYVQAAKRHGIKANPVILLPDRPDEDLCGLVHSLGITLVVRSSAGFDVAPGDNSR